MKTQQITQEVTTAKPMPTFGSMKPLYKGLVIRRIGFFVAGALVLAIAGYIESTLGASLFYHVVHIAGFVITASSALGVMEEIFKIQQAEYARRSSIQRAWSDDYLSPLVEEWVEKLGYLDYNGKSSFERFDDHTLPAVIRDYEEKVKDQNSKSSKALARPHKGSGYSSRIYVDGVDTDTFAVYMIEAKTPNKFRLSSHVDAELHKKK